MPTITFSWTDLTLFLFTTTFIGIIFFIGRPNAWTPSTNNSSKKTSNKKKKNSNKKNPNNLNQIFNNSTNSPTSSASNQSSPSKVEFDQKSSFDTKIQKTHQITKPSNKKTNLVPLPINPLQESEFPPLSKQNDQQQIKSTNNPMRPFAERARQPAPKTMVDDMLDPDIEKPLKMARVMSVVDQEPKLAPFVIQQEPELAPVVDSDLENGWEKVPDSKKSRNSTAANSVISSVSRPTSSSHSQPTSAQTKRQRQNAKKKEAAKTLKASEEAERLNRLSTYKGQQEQVRMNAQFKAQKSP
ncbi:hypothetical protein O181_048192 [Austropuccinia psidii MF-1]|uniref:Uncharacterized protein n=1 Tax=Austropuccinia psidii MF-1 TaxID=1389203 RepID=A0A9Q3DUM7_9BASI|nr:hypothetical protein [Austropuccinia psidii MF-1]